MTDTMQPMRHAFDAVLKGNVNYNGSVINFYDEKVFTGSADTIYVLYSTQREQDVSDTGCAWNTISKIDLLIVDKTGSEVSKDHIDDISNTIYGLLATLPGSDNLPVQSGFQILYLRKETVVEGLFQISPTQSELRKLITFSANVISS